MKLLTVSLGLVLFMVGCGSESVPALPSSGQQGPSTVVPATPIPLRSGRINCQAALQGNVSVTYSVTVLPDQSKLAQASLTIPDTSGDVSYARNLTYHAANNYGDGGSSDSAAAAVWLGSPQGFDPNTLDPQSPKYDASAANKYPTGQMDGAQFVVGLNIPGLLLSVSGDGVPTQGSHNCQWE